MTHVIHATNVNDALPAGLWWLKIAGLDSDSRNGRVVVSPEPVMTVYKRPDQRVLFAPVRDANPFFHLMESLWMLAGRNDVKFVSYYAGNMGVFSDDGRTLHGAYGYRWRESMGFDQLPIIIEELKTNPQSRRCVLQMWDSAETSVSEGHHTSTGQRDLHKAVSGGLDVPCNTQAYFDTLGGKLNMTVTCRSNDVVWGCYGANAVHFSFLLEYVACATGIPMGVYRQFSNNYHIYADRPDVQRLLNADGSPSVGCFDLYDGTAMPPFPLMVNYETWNADMDYFFHVAWGEKKLISPRTFKEPFWEYVVRPLVNAHHMYKMGDNLAARGHAETCAADDWRIACGQWLLRRKGATHAKVA